MLAAGDFKIRAYIRECIKVSHKDLNGCHSNNDVSKVLMKNLKFVPGLRVIKFQGDLCLCAEDHCLVKGCAKHHFSIPYVGQYGKWLVLKM